MDLPHTFKVGQLVWTSFSAGGLLLDSFDKKAPIKRKFPVAALCQNNKNAIILAHSTDEFGFQKMDFETKRTDKVSPQYINSYLQHVDYQTCIPLSELCLDCSDRINYDSKI